MDHKCEGCRYKGEHQEMMFRPMGVCNRGANLLEAIKNYEAEKCPYKKTNADRIRAMSDEELAEMLNKAVVCHQLRELGYCHKCPLFGATPCDTEGLLEWLKQPAEVER